MNSPIITAPQEQLDPLKYQGDAISDSSNPTLNAMYASTDALMAETEANGVLVDLKRPGGTNDRAPRARLTLGITNAEDQTVDELLFLVTPCEMRDGINEVSSPVIVEPIATLAWVNGTASVVGGRTGETLPKSVTISNTGRLASISGIEAAKAGASPEMVAIYDVGHATHLLRLIAGGTAASASPLGLGGR